MNQSLLYSPSGVFERHCEQVGPAHWCNFLCGCRQRGKKTPNQLHTIDLAIET